MAGDPWALESRCSNEHLPDLFTYLIITLSNSDGGRRDVEEKCISLWNSVLAVFDVDHWWRLVATADVNAWWVNVGWRVRLVDEVSKSLGVDNAFHFWICFVLSLVYAYWRVEVVIWECDWDYYSNSLLLRMLFKIIIIC